MLRLCPAAPAQQFTSRYEAKLSRMRTNEERVKEAYLVEDTKREEYDANKLENSKDLRRRWRGHVNHQTEKMDSTYGRENFAVIRYGGQEAVIRGSMVGRQCRLTPC